MLYISIVSIPTSMLLLSYGSTESPQHTKSSYCVPCLIVVYVLFSVLIPFISNTCVVLQFICFSLHIHSRMCNYLNLSSIL